MSLTHPQTRSEAELSASPINDTPTPHVVGKFVNGVSSDDHIDVKGEVIGETRDEDGTPHTVVAHTTHHEVKDGKH